MSKYHIHLVSDSTGETVNSVSRSVLAQFDGVEAEEHLWSLVRTKGQIERVLEAIEESPGIVIYTVVNKDLQNILKDGCRSMGIPCISVLSRIIREVASYLGEEVNSQPGRQYELDEDYFSRIEAINYTLAHDDGQQTHELEEADVVLVGPSRTSKTPTCVYLAYRGFYAANVPYVMGCPVPENLFNLQGPLVVGLTISPERLVQIRKTRLQGLHEERESNYVEMDRVKAEVIEAKKIFAQQKWPVIDVTRRSIEETVAKIITLFKEHQESKELK